MTQPTSTPPESPLHSVYTSGLPELFAHLNISLAVTTYQAGKVILVRHDRGAFTNGHGSASTMAPSAHSVINTHFRTFHKPMGLAVQGNKLAIGGQKTVWELHNMPAVARKLDPAGKHDACYLPRRIHITGDIDIHEMAYTDDGELWLANTRFDCLCTLDSEHSFHPRWRPPFVSAYAPEDRCHLNGLAMVDGRPKYITALGESDTPGGWRANKAAGGLLMDIERNEILLRGLSMPHSPAGTTTNSTSSNLARAASPVLTWRRRAIHHSPLRSSPASPAASISTARSLLSASRRCAIRPPLAGCP